MVPTYLFKFGNYIFPLTCIVESGYKTKPNQRQDLDPFTDQRGYTHRNALAHSKTEVTITTRPNLSWDEMDAIITGITSNYANYNERSAQCTYWDEENRRMSTATMYLESSQGFDLKLLGQKYDSVTFTFVEN